MLTDLDDFEPKRSTDRFGGWLNAETVWSCPWFKVQLIENWYRITVPDALSDGRTGDLADEPGKGSGAVVNAEQKLTAPETHSSGSLKNPDQTIVQNNQAVGGTVSGAIAIAVSQDDVRDGEARFVLVEQYRRHIETSTIEFPRGAIDKNETVLDCAARELFEETGCETTSAQLLGFIRPDTGLLGTKVAVVLCRIAPDQNAKPIDGDEIDKIYSLTRSQINAAIVDGRFRDGLSLSALALLDALTGM